MSDSKTDTLKVTENEDGSFTLEWDPEDHTWSWMNSMSQEEVTKIVEEALDQYLKKLDLSNNE